MRFRSAARGRHGDLAPVGREPFDLLELHPVPGRVADHGVEAAGQLRSFPVRPHAGECHLPVQETLTGYQSQGIHQKGKVGIRRISLLPLGDVDLIAEHTIQPLEKRGLDLTLSDAQPSQRREEAT